VRSRRPHCYGEPGPFHPYLVDYRLGCITSTLSDSATSLPAEFTTHRVLPSLVSALSYGGASASATIPLLIRLGAVVPDAEYTKTILEPLVKLYENPDRGVRMALLEALPNYVERLEKKMVSDKIWPHLVSDVMSA
jgi:SCY1-like protein 1